MAKAPRYEGLTPQTQPADAVRAILGVLFAAALREAPAVLHEQDVRATHDMRVALRRLRSALETFGAEFARTDLRARERALRRLARRLGDVRDADVHLAELRATLGGATASESQGIAYAIEVLVAKRRTALARFAIELSQLDRDAIVGEPPVMTGSRKPLRTFARHAIRKRLRKVLRQSSAIPAGGDAALHALRKEVKRLRYTLEFFADLLGPAGGEALEATARVQDRLGTIADAVAFARAYAELLEGLDRADPRRPGLEACRDTARARREKALAGLRKLWAGDGADAYPGKLAASTSSALGSLSPKSAANGPAGAASKRGR
jgi:CHAD domain-containing protein